MPNIFEHKQKLDLDDIRRFDVDEINMSKRSKAAGQISLRADIQHPAECVNRHLEAALPLDESLDACKEYVAGQNEGERK